MTAPRSSATDAACLTWGTLGTSGFIHAIPEILSLMLTALGVCWYAIQIYQWIKKRKTLPDG